VGSDDECSQGGRRAPSHAPTVASSVLHHDIAGGQQHLRAIVELEYQVAGENDPEILESVLCMPGSSPSSTCIPGKGSGATTSDSGEYVAMAKRMPPTGGNGAGAAGLSPAFG